MRCLLNETYIFLLQNPKEPINASRIGETIGRNRKTVAKQIQELREDGLITNDNVVINVHDITVFYPNVDKYTQALLMLQDCGYRIDSLEMASRLLDVSSKTLKPYYDEAIKLSSENSIYDGPAVYQITPYDSDEVIYIGYTTNFANRRRQHLSAINNMSVKTELYKYCVDNSIKKVKITTVIEHTDLQMLRHLESYLIGLLCPVGNATII